MPLTQQHFCRLSTTFVNQSHTTDALLTLLLQTGKLETTTGLSTEIVAPADFIEVLCQGHLAY